MEKVGCPTKLTKELSLKIRELVLDGENYIDIQRKLEISAGTWDYWVYDNYQGFRDDLQNWKYEKMVRKAEKKVDILIDSEDEKVALNASQFILSRLNKEKYSDRTEHTGENGKDIKILLSPEIANKNELNTSTETNS